MRRFIPMALIAALLLCICGCATTSKAKDLEPSTSAEPVSEPQAEPSKPPAVTPPSPPAAPPPAAHPPAKKDARAQEPPPVDIENKPLPVLPADPPPPVNAEDLGDDNWGRDQRHTKIRDKDRDKVKGSEPEDDGWGKE